MTDGTWIIEIDCTEDGEWATRAMPKKNYDAGGPNHWWPVRVSDCSTRREALRKTKRAIKGHFWAQKEIVEWKP